MAVNYIVIIETPKSTRVLVKILNGQTIEVMSDELLDSPPNCLVFACETKGAFDITSSDT